MNGCALPAPMAFLSYANTGYSTVQTIRNEKTLTDEIISEIKEKECKTRNILEKKEYCEEANLADNGVVAEW